MHIFDLKVTIHAPTLQQTLMHPLLIYIDPLSQTFLHGLIKHNRLAMNGNCFYRRDTKSHLLETLISN